MLSSSVITGDTATSKPRQILWIKSPCQTGSQVNASWKLGSTCASVWPGLAYTCIDLRWLALTLVEIKFARKSKYVFHRLATQPKSTQVEWRSLETRPKGVSSRCKLKSWIYLWLRLARPCVHLRWLAMTCAHFGRVQICAQVKASFSPFDRPTQVNASWVTLIREQAKGSFK